MQPPRTCCARAGEVHIAYQCVGNGSRDVLFVPGFVSNVEDWWEEPTCVRFLECLASFSRVILFDKRGTGLLDRVAHVPSLEERADDILAVLDAAKSQRADRLFTASFFGLWTRILVDLVGIAPRHAVLDIAIGPGTVARYSTCRYLRPRVGIDLSRPMLHVARGKPTEFGAAPVEFIQRSAADLQLPDRPSTWCCASKDCSLSLTGPPHSAKRAGR